MNICHILDKSAIYIFNSKKDFEVFNKMFAEKFKKHIADHHIVQYREHFGIRVQFKGRELKTWSTGSAEWYENKMWKTPGGAEIYSDDPMYTFCTGIEVL